MTEELTRILDSRQTRQKINRMAYEIYEHNPDETEIVLAGIYDRGYTLAKLLFQELQSIAPFKLTLVKISLDKLAPTQTDITLDINPEVLANKTIIVVDDVLNTGRTVAYSLKPFLNVRVKKIQTVFLIDRNYKTFPISADYVGYSLSTLLKDNVKVVLDDDSTFGVYIS